MVLEGRVELHVTERSWMGVNHTQAFTKLRISIIRYRQS